MAGRFEDMPAIVTGAGSGIGRATTLALARDGADVLAVDRDRTGAEDTARLGNGPGRILALTSDVCDDGAPAEIVARCEADLGALRILINNVTPHAQDITRYRIRYEHRPRLHTAGR